MLLRKSYRTTFPSNEKKRGLWITSASDSRETGTCPASHPYRGSPGSAASGSRPGSRRPCRCRHCPVLQHTEPLMLPADAPLGCQGIYLMAAFRPGFRGSQSRYGCFRLLRINNWAYPGRLFSVRPGGSHRARWQRSTSSKHFVWWWWHWVFASFLLLLYSKLKLI